MAHLATAYPPLLRTALKTLRTLISVAWPRVAYHKGVMLKGLTTLWCRLEEYEPLSEELAEVQKATKLTTHTLLSELGTDIDEVKKLSEVNPRIETLLAA